MSRNIKEIGKELMGKSLNSFHRKLGLTQLEENNKMQDGILNGILSQVDDAYIEKTEQSNVIHLDGSGDGVVVVDGVEGNTMVNLCNKTTHTIIGENSNNWNKNIYLKRPLVVGNKYTLIINVKSYTLDKGYSIMGRVSVNQNTEVQYGLMYTVNKAGIHKNVFTAQKALDMLSIADENNSTSGESIVEDFILLEGDYTNKEINYFEGLQSSFEEKVNENGKYEIEILSSNKNLWNGKLYSGWGGETPIMQELGSRDNIITDFIRVKKNTTYYINIPSCTYSWLYDKDKKLIKSNLGTINAYINGTNSEDAYYMIIGKSVGNAGIDKNELKNVMISKVKNEKYVPQKQNKIKLLLNEPLRAVKDIKDRLCVKDGKLAVKRKCGKIKMRCSDLNLTINGGNFTDTSRGFYTSIPIDSNNRKPKNCNTDSTAIVEDNFGTKVIALADYSNGVRISIYFNYNPTNYPAQATSLESFTSYMQNKILNIVYELEEPYYEEVLNEYGEPILLEGYENGTIYIDSTIVPITTVRYTPKMDSFKTLKEVNNNNIMLTNDVNDNIIPYMMDVDLMIMEKEMALMSHQYKLRRTGEKDMTSMQKRTQDMLTRLIKGKTLTEQECKTRVVTYLDAGKITDAQADELMLLISEVYA